MKIIQELESPLCPMSAAVIQENDACYFYIVKDTGSGRTMTHALWLCNCKDTPEKLSPPVEGKPPMLHKPYVSPLHPADGMELDPQKLAIYWYPSGDGAGVFYDKKVLCCIPPYAGVHGLPGFSRYIKGKTPFGWEFPPEDNDFLAREAKEALGFWGFISSDPWNEIQQWHMSAIEEFFGDTDNIYFSSADDRFPPRAIVQGQKNGVTYGISIGISIFPMPGIENIYKERSLFFCRTELGFAAKEELSDVCPDAYSAITEAANLPWTEVSWFDHGHTLDFDKIDGFQSALLINPNLVSGLEIPPYKDYQGTKMNLLWLIPITEQERIFLRDNGLRALLDKCSDISKVHIFDGKPKFLSEE